LYDLIVTSILGIPADISDTARPAFRIMLLWTAAIGWRRFYQGILVRQGQTTRVSYGTAIRLISAIGTAFVLVQWGRLPGAQVGAYALMVAVIAEALAVYIFALPVVRQAYQDHAVQPEQPLTQAAIFRFHLPLATTSLLTLIVQPVTAAALARMDNPKLTLAAWPVVFTTLLVLRGWGMALQETTVAQAAAPTSFAPLRDFSRSVAVVTSLVTALLAFTPLLDLHLAYIMSLEASLWPFVRIGLQISILLPAATALTSWLRGLLVAAKQTSAIYQGMGINLMVNVAILVAGVVLNLPGVPVAATGLLFAISIEYIYLRRRYDAVARRQTVPTIGEPLQVS
jgi:hypothetical protein